MVRVVIVPWFGIMVRKYEAELKVKEQVEELERLPMVKRCLVNLLSPAKSCVVCPA